MNRRELLRIVGTGVVLGSVEYLNDWRAGAAFARLERASDSFVPDVEIALRAEPGNVDILPGRATHVWRYSGRVLKGPAETLQAVPDSYLGPVIRLRKGQKVRIRFFNALPEPTSVHWHGLDVPAEMDGHPRLAIDAEKEYVYEFEVINRAGTYWYHPHPHERTGLQAYRGLAGLLLVSDDEESALKLPSGSDELLFVIQDRRFDRDSQLWYDPGHMSQLHGFLGDQILVNGRPSRTVSLATRAYRLRLLNGSNARIYKLAWSDGTPMTLIGSDGGLLEHPHQRNSLTLAPGQRADAILDLRRHGVGARLELESAAFPASDIEGTGMSGMGMGRMGMRGMGMTGMNPDPNDVSDMLRNGAPLSILNVDVVRRETSSFTLPQTLSTFGAIAEASGPARRLELSFQFGSWLLDGRTFEMTEVASNDTVPRGSTQVWDIVNTAGMMGMEMAHPIHFHGRQFRVIDRQRRPGMGDIGNAVREGLMDEGWKDTVLVMPGDTVRIQIPFTRYPGLYLYHCHILEHEDMGMMRNYRVL